MSEVKGFLYTVRTEHYDDFIVKYRKWIHIPSLKIAVGRHGKIVNIENDNNYRGCNLIGEIQISTETCEKLLKYQKIFTEYQEDSDIQSLIID